MMNEDVCILNLGPKRNINLASSLKLFESYHIILKIIRVLIKTLFDKRLIFCTCVIWTITG